VSPVVLAYLRTGEYPESHGEADFYTLFEKAGDHGAGLREDWEAARTELLAGWVQDHPGSRPWPWWRFDAPRWARADWPARQRCLGAWADDLFAEPRRRLGGIGDPAFEHLNILPAFRAGIPTSWVDAWSARYYRGEARDIHGAPIGLEFVGHHFAGLAIDPNDPPRFESSAAYLLRHHLLRPDEERRLPAEAFEPEVVAVDDEFEAP
jgi:hypothetical protein